MWNACPPKPAPQSGRWGWFHSASSSAKCSPPSVERHTAPGSVPAHTTPSSAPGVSCQTRSTDASSLSSNRIAPLGVSCQVAPRSSDQRTCGPSQLEDAPESSRGAPSGPLTRLSTMQE